jgi:hypothetical protein
MTICFTLTNEILFFPIVIFSNSSILLDHPFSHLFNSFLPSYIFVLSHFLLHFWHFFHAFISLLGPETVVYGFCRKGEVKRGSATTVDMNGGFYGCRICDDGESEESEK